MKCNIEPSSSPLFFCGCEKNNIFATLSARPFARSSGSLNDLYIQKLFLGGCACRLVLETIGMILLDKLQVRGLQDGARASPSDVQSQEGMG